MYIFTIIYTTCIRADFSRGYEYFDSNRFYLFIIISIYIEIIIDPSYLIYISSNQ